MSDRSRQKPPPPPLPDGGGARGRGFDVGGIDAAIGEFAGDVEHGPVAAVELTPSTAPGASPDADAVHRYSEGFAPTDEQLSLAPTDIEPPDESARDLVSRLPPPPVPAAVRPATPAPIGSPRPARPVPVAQAIPAGAPPAAAHPSTLSGTPAPSAQPVKARPIQNVETAFVQNPLLQPRPPAPAVTSPQWGATPAAPPVDDTAHQHPTTLGMPELTDAPQRGRLVVQGGEWDGTTWYLNRVETRLGRGEENDVVILDIGVSRRHLVITRHPQGFRLIDLQSGNGTYLNGRRIAEAELYDGDRIELGHTTLAYDTVGQTRRRRPLGMTDAGRPAVGRRVPTTWLIAMALTTFLTVLGTMYLVRTLRGGPPEEPVAESNSIDNARTAIIAREWELARAALATARAEGAASGDVLADLTEQVEDGAADAALITKAEAAIGSGATPEAITEMLARIEPGSPYAGNVRTLIRRAEQQALERRIDEAEALFKDGKTEAARAMVRAVLEEQRSNRRALDLRTRIEALE